MYYIFKAFNRLYLLIIFIITARKRSCWKVIFSEVCGGWGGAVLGGVPSFPLQGVPFLAGEFHP